MGLDGSVCPGGWDVGNTGQEVCGVPADVAPAEPDSPAGRRRCWSPANRGPREAAPRRRPHCPEDEILTQVERRRLEKGKWERSHSRLQEER